MCGIVGYLGKKNASEILCDGLKKLEYRGYDSAGIALLNGSGFRVLKTSKRIETLSKTVSLEKSQSKIGIGHTRWATHGEANKQNAHPHLSEDGKFAVVHNGIIENYLSLKEELLKEGFKLKSETDTEVIPMLLQKYYKKDIKEAVKKTLKRLEGSYALAILCSDYPDMIIAARQFSPIIIGLSETEKAVASDITAFPEDINNVIYLKDGQVSFLSSEKCEVFDSSMKSVTPEITPFVKGEYFGDKEEYEHFMMKEIREQPRVIEETVKCYVRNDKPVFHHIDPEIMKNINKIHIIACGSAYHAGVVAKYFFEEIIGMPVSVDIASEYRYRTCLADGETLAIAISQSGETADTIAAITRAKENGAKTLSIVNVKNSSLTKITDYVVYTLAGPEIAVATTKGYTTQLTLLYILGLWIGKIRNSVSEEVLSELIGEIKRLPEITFEALKKEKEIKKTAKILSSSQSVFFMGRNMDYAVALEGSLKLKEISYSHCETYAAGELKHGTLALIEKGTPVIALTSYEELKSKTESNIKEVAARGGFIINSGYGNSIGDIQIIVPKVHPLLSASAQIVPLQLLAYYTALYKDCDIDKPKNLAKSVTVE